MIVHNRILPNVDTCGIGKSDIDLEWNDFHLASLIQPSITYPMERFPPPKRTLKEASAHYVYGKSSSQQHAKTTKQVQTHHLTHT